MGAMMAKPPAVIVFETPRLLLTIKEAALYLRVSTRTVHTLIKTKQLSYTRVREGLRFVCSGSTIIWTSAPWQRFEGSMPRPKKEYMPAPTPAPVPAPAPSNPERISYAGYEEASKATGISENELSEAVGKLTEASCRTRFGPVRGTG